VEELPDSIVKTGIVELTFDSRRVPFCTGSFYRTQGNRPGGKGPATENPGPWFQMALTNPEYTRFAIKTTLAILACEIFHECRGLARHSHQHDHLRCDCAGKCRRSTPKAIAAPDRGLRGRVDGTGVNYLSRSPDGYHRESIALGRGRNGLLRLGRRRSVRSSYAGFQMVLAFYIMLLPGFDTSIDLTGIRDRFVGILVGNHRHVDFLRSSLAHLLTAANGGQIDRHPPAHGEGPDNCFPHHVSRRSPRTVIFLSTRNIQ